MPAQPYIEFVLQAYQNYLPLAPPLILLSLGLIALTQAVGRFLNMNQLIVWGKLELFELFFSAFILLIFPFALGSMNEIAATVITSLPYGPDICPNAQQATIPCHIAYAKQFLNSMFIELDYVIFRQLAWYSVISLLTNTEISLEVGMISKPWAPFMIFHAKELIIRDTVQHMFTFMLALKVIENTFAFISLFFFPLMLIGGVLLRILKYTRRLGGLLIAIALVSHYITPIPFIVGGMLYNQYRIDQGLPYSDLKPVLYKAKTTSSTGVPAILDLKDNDIYDSWKKSYESQSQGQAIDYTTSNMQYQLKDNLVIEPYVDPHDASSVSSGIASFLLEAISFTKYLSLYVFTAGFGQGESIVDFIYGIDLVKKGGALDVSGTVLAYVFFFTFISLLSSIAAVRSLSETFGGDSEIAGLTRLI
ncbi:MAG: hypothetical protein QW035_02870 [Candidatus Anstonellales archaeon]